MAASATQFGNLLFDMAAKRASVDGLALDRVAGVPASGTFLTNLNNVMGKDDLLIAWFSWISRRHPTRSSFTFPGCAEKPRYVGRNTHRAGAWLCGGSQCRKLKPALGLTRSENAC